MFGQKQKNLQPTTPANQKINLDQRKDFKVNDIEVHTLEKDLKNYKYSGVTPTEMKPSPPPVEKKLPESQPMKPLNKPTPSPFLNFSQPTQPPKPSVPKAPEKVMENFSQAKPTPTPIAKPPVFSALRNLPQAKPTTKPPVFSASKNMPPQDKKTLEKPKKEGNLAKIITTTIIVLVILIVGVGAYYFWITRQKIEEVVINQPEENPISEPEIIPEDKPEETVLNENYPNYLMIDLAIEASTAQTIKETIKKVKASGLETPIEFIASDAENNPISFSKFSENLGIKFSSEVLTGLDDTTFSLFIQNDASENIGLGMALYFTDKTGLKTTMQKEEAFLINELKPFLNLAMIYDTIKEASFSSAKYDGRDIRYINIISPEELTIDYAVNGEKKLFIATTKQSLEGILQKMVFDIESE